MISQVWFSSTRAILYEWGKIILLLSAGGRVSDVKRTPKRSLGPQKAEEMETGRPYRRDKIFKTNRRKTNTGASSPILVRRCQYSVLYICSTPSPPPGLPPTETLPEIRVCQPNPYPSHLQSFTPDSARVNHGVFRTGRCTLHRIRTVGQGEARVAPKVQMARHRIASHGMSETSTSAPFEGVRCALGAGSWELGRAGLICAALRC